MATTAAAVGGGVSFLRRNDRDARAPWQEETVDVAGHRYTQKQCFLRAAELDDRSCKAWVSLATVLTEDEEVVVRGQVYDARACLAAGLAAAPDMPRAWRKLGILLFTYDGPGRHASFRVGLPPTTFPDGAAPLRDPPSPPSSSSSASPNDVGQQPYANPPRLDAATSQYVVRVGVNDAVSAMTCFVSALSQDPADTLSWAALGNLMAPSDDDDTNETDAKICGVRHTRADVLARLASLTGEAGFLPQ